MKLLVLPPRSSLLLLICLSFVVSANGVMSRVSRDPESGETLKLVVGQSHRRPLWQQTHFNAEESIQDPIEVPKDVLQILRRDARNQTCLVKGQSEETLPASWFVASKVNVSSSLPDLVIMAVHPCLNGANVVPFWVFNGNSGRYILALRSNGLALDLLKTRSKGHRDIRLTSVSATTEYTTLYKFNGTKYQAQRHSVKQLGK